MSDVVIISHGNMRGPEAYLGVEPAIQQAKHDGTEDACDRVHRTVNTHHLKHYPQHRGHHHPPLNISCAGRPQHTQIHRVPGVQGQRHAPGRACQGARIA
eukprot:1195116-Prorocentrum_minimum.AAC.6